MAATIQSALVVLVPEAEHVVRPFREAHDPSAALGMPAHITLLFPFLPPSRITRAVVDGLATCFGRFQPFRFSLREARRFPGVLYFVPDPDDPFRVLTMAIWRQSPETPPYDGKHPDIVPHLSIAQINDEIQLDAVAKDFARSSANSLPIAAAATQVALMDNGSGHWKIQRLFHLAVGT